MNDRPQRRLPAFSIRTLLIVMTLLCAYAACWQSTRTQGVRDVAENTWPLDANGSPDAVAPMLIAKTVSRFEVDPTDPLNKYSARPSTQFFRCYYFWFCGYFAKLPYERSIPRPVIGADRQASRIDDLRDEVLEAWRKQGFDPDDPETWPATDPIKAWPQQQR